MRKQWKTRVFQSLILKIACKTNQLKVSDELRAKIRAMLADTLQVLL